MAKGTTVETSISGMECFPAAMKGLQNMLIQPASSAEACSYLIEGNSSDFELCKDRFVEQLVKNVATHAEALNCSRWREAAAGRPV